TSATRLPSRPGYGAWELSADRANAVRQILEQEGVSASSLFMVAGKADTQPLFPDDPFIAANRRITITLMRGAPPLPPGFNPVGALVRGSPAALRTLPKSVLPGFIRCCKGRLFGAAGAPASAQRNVRKRRWRRSPPRSACRRRNRRRMGNRRPVRRSGH